MIFKRIFNRDAKRGVSAPLMRGGETLMTSRQQDEMRTAMEASVTADRKRRGATDTRPGEAANTK